MKYDKVYEQFISKMNECEFLGMVSSFATLGDEKDMHEFLSYIKNKDKSVFDNIIPTIKKSMEQYRQCIESSDWIIKNCNLSDETKFKFMSKVGSICDNVFYSTMYVNSLAKAIEEMK